MKKIFLAALMALCTLTIHAQSSMTDDQVIAKVAQMNAAGKSQAQIVTQLMQSGVDISQIRRIREKYQKTSSKKNTLGMQSDDTGSRLRKQNGQLNRESNIDNSSTYRESSISLDDDYTNYDANGDRIPLSDKQKDLLRKQQIDEMIENLDELTPKDSTRLFQMLIQQQQDHDKPRIFGHDIFNNDKLTFESDINIATPQHYRLGPGDAVNIDIYGASQKSVTATISPDGDVVIEGYGPINLSGLTVAQANAKLRRTLGSRYRSSQIKLTVGQTKTITVNVMGEVKSPGTYTLSAFATVFQALYMAQGVDDIGTLRNIKVYRHNRLISVVDLYDYILNGKLTGNVRLTDNDVIIVGPYDCLVQITGKVKRPMFYEMKKNESLSSVLKYAGGFTGDAYRKIVRVSRKTGKEHTVFNVSEFDFSSFRINDGDSVSVDSVLPRYENTVELKGAVFRPGLYHISGECNSVRSLIEQAEGLTEDAFTNRAIIHRMKADRTLEVVSLDLEGIMSGRVADVPLKENDVVFIPTKTEKNVKRTLTIRGEVLYPGIYEYADNETLEDFILQAGGLTDKASVVKVDVSRRVMNPKALEIDSIIGKTYSLSLKDGFVVDGEPGFILMPYDEVYVRKSPAYSDQQNVSVSGEVMFPGTYTLTKRNARLTDLLEAAGGANNLAYIKGARLERKVNNDERKRMETLLKMAQEEKRQNLSTQLLSNTAITASAELLQKQQQQELNELQAPDYYPVGIELDKALKNPGSDANIILREGDRLVLPRYNASVKINGSVLYPNTVTYERGKGARYYIDAAGGFAQNARKSSAYIIYMNGMVGQVSHGAKIEPGCEIYVPSKLTRKWTPAEYMSMGSSFASMATMLATIWSILK
ncbi:SLBB domain-containing protein [Prevotella sp. AGR2160]|uniref:SLBB domain-containing protein n=1 Tax=Prevotella sp. AGR2160 TaxID=1280674 RepID=UPI000424D0C2|nr:SLBB domain-containing protein [Prevotella sp. AGR2160]